MPQIKVDYIVSFSSEHPDHPANNLLSKDFCNKRWVSLNKGESSVSIVFQLEKSSEINSIRIGNYHSALIEVLVGRSEANNKQYEVLLCTSSFMTPSDARNSVNISSVRTFNAEQLVQSVQGKKWDRIRVVCTQPYNRHVQYGLSFIHFFSSDSSGSSSSAPNLTETKMIGKFKFRDDFNSDNELESLFKPGELFHKTKNKADLSIEAQIRQAGLAANLDDASSSFLVKTNRPSVNPSKNKVKKEDETTLSRKRDEILYDANDDSHHKKIDKVIEIDRLEKEKTLQINKLRSELHEIKKEINNSSNGSKETKQSVNNKENNDEKLVKKKEPKFEKKRTHSPDKITPSKKQCINHNETLPKNQKELNVVRGDNCLKGVTFVISGYVNPRRSTMRDTAISLGARYSPDWNDNCTHLICAFANTPKHDQVRRSRKGGKVVTADWIENCGKEKAHLPWKWYATDPKERVTRPPTSLSSQPSTSASYTRNEEAKSTEVDDGDTDDEIEKVLKEEELKKDKAKKLAQKLQVPEEDSDTDIEDIIEAAKQFDEVKNPYQEDTEPEYSKDDQIDNDDDFTNENLPDLFTGIKFYIDPSVMEDGYECLLLHRYITAYNGEVLKTWPDKAIDVIVTTENIVDRLRNEKLKKAIFIKPDWVWKCHETKTLFPYEDYNLK